ncbi:RNA polymerase sigma-70 factor, ECF subfamily [Dyadobacter sp. SG02]|nr:RNA polymerase sigma-70 factor, ECF subfamily [Dyadobacter sp. SG02]
MIVEKYKDMSLSLISSYIIDEQEAEDVLQDAFIKTFNHIHQFRFDSLFSTWLYRIVVNTCLRNKERDRAGLFEELSEIEFTHSYEITGIDLLEQNERNAYISLAFKMMKSEEALLLRLFYLCELSIAEIHQVTAYSEANIKVILHRARKSMYEILVKLTGNDLKI